MTMPDPRRARFSSVRRWVPVSVLAVSLLVTFVSSAVVASISNAKDRIRFENSVQQTQDLIKNRLQTYVAILRAGTGLFTSPHSVDRDQFHAFVDRLDLKEHYPGIQGIGFSLRIRHDEKAEAVARIRREGNPAFEIKPAGPRETYHAIVFLEPLDRRNRVAIGYDMHTEAVRREAMDRARDEGAATASGKVTLVQEIDSDKQAGFLIYVPVYRGGEIPRTVAERRRDLAGFVYSPFRADDLLRGILRAQQQPRVDFQVYDGPVTRPMALLHDSKLVRGAEREQYTPRFRRVTSIPVAGRTWGLVFSTRPEFELASGQPLILAVAVGGVLVSLVLYGLTAAQARAQRSAESLAEQLRVSEQTAREDARALEAVNRIGFAVAAELDLRNLVQTLTDEATSLCRAEFGSFFYNVTNEAGESYTLYTLSGAPPEAFSSFPMPRNTHVFGPTFRGEGIVRSDDITRDPRYGKNPPYNGMPKGHLPVRSYLAVPVVSRTGEVLGGLFFGHSQKGIFTERDERIIASVAAQAAIAVDNARLFAEAQNEIVVRTRAEEDLRAQEARILDLNERLRRAMVETHHRVKNNLQVVAAMVDMLTLDYDESVPVGEAKRIGSHVQTLAAVHDLLTQEAKEDPQADSLSARRILEKLIPLVRESVIGRDIVAEMEDARLSPRQATSLALVANEVISNAAKHGRGRIDVQFTVRDHHATFAVADEGEGFAPGFDPSKVDTTGMTLIDRLSRWDLGGVVAFTNRPSGGAVVTVTIPLNGAAAGAETDAAAHA